MNDIQRIIESVPAAIAEEGDYEDGGLLYCGKCHTPKQFMAPFPWGEQIVKISCACEKEASEKLEALKKEYERRDRINDLRKDGLPFSLRESTFDKDDGTNTEIMNLAKQYAEKWEKMVKKKEGLLFWGGTGSGKTFAAACIANYLIDREIRVMMTPLARILSMDINDRGQFLENLSRYELLILDDLGSERSNQYALEIAYRVIDDRYTLGKPLIVTTNLSLDAIRTADTIEYQRIYDRIIEMCVPVQFKAESLRRKIADDKLVELKAILRGGDGK